MREIKALPLRELNVGFLRIGDRAQHVKSLVASLRLAASSVLVPRSVAARLGLRSSAPPYEIGCLSHMAAGSAVGRGAMRLGIVA